MFLTIKNANDSVSPTFGHALITQVGQTEIDFYVWIFWCTKEGRGHWGEIISFVIEFSGHPMANKAFIYSVFLKDSESTTFCRARYTQVRQFEGII